MLILYHLRAILVVLMALIIVLPVCLAAIPFPLERRIKMVGPAWELVLYYVVRYAFAAKVDVLEDHRSPQHRTRPHEGVYISNHQSYVDIPLLSSVYQVPPIMKKEVMYIPVIGWLGWICGAMPVSRGSAESRKRVFAETRRRLIKRRIGVQVYPEGTRSKDARPKPFEEIKRTLLVFAYNEGLIVVPTSIFGTRGVLSSNGIISPHRHVGIIVHKEIDPKEFPTAEEFSRACWARVIEGYERMERELGPLNAAGNA
jgi:1-acyl-sn-glycerol-3-phosphate acyltransferase